MVTSGRASRHLNVCDFKRAPCGLERFIDYRSFRPTNMEVESPLNGRERSLPRNHKGPFSSSMFVSRSVNLQDLDDHWVLKFNIVP